MRPRFILIVATLVAASLCHPDSAECEALMQQKKYREAIDCYHVLVDNVPEHPAVWLNAALAFHGTGNAMKAMEAYEQVIALAPTSTDAATASTNMGVLCQQQQKEEDAMRFYQQATNLNPKATGAFVNMAMIQYSKGNTHDAVQSCMKALEADPKCPGAFMNLGVIFQQEGMLEQAIQAFSSVVDLNPTNPDAHYNLGTAYNGLGQVGKAAMHFQLAIRVQEQAQKRIKPVYFGEFARALLETQLPEGQEAYIDESRHCVIGRYCRHERTLLHVSPHNRTPPPASFFVHAGNVIMDWTVQDDGAGIGGASLSERLAHLHVSELAYTTAIALDDSLHVAHYQLGHCHLHRATLLEQEPHTSELTSTLASESSISQARLAAIDSFREASRLLPSAVVYQVAVRDAAIEADQPVPFISPLASPLPQTLFTRTKIAHAVIDNDAFGCPNSRFLSPRMVMDALSRSSLMDKTVVSIGIDDVVSAYPLTSLFLTPSSLRAVVLLSPSVNTTAVLTSLTPLRTVEIVRVPTGAFAVDAVFNELKTHNVYPNLDMLHIANVPNSCQLAARLVQQYQPKLLVLEVNSAIPPPILFSASQAPGHEGLWGCSLSSASLALGPHGYSLLQLDWQTAFYLRSELFDAIKQEPVDDLSAFLVGSYARTSRLRCTSIFRNSLNFLESDTWVAGAMKKDGGVAVTVDRIEAYMKTIQDHYIPEASSAKTFTVTALP